MTIFLVLTYILLSISVWVKSMEASERSFSEFFKESTVELSIEQITPAKMDNVTYILMSRSLFRLDEHAIDHPVRPGASEDENIQGSMSELLMNGNASGARFLGGVPIPSEENSSFTAWAENLNASLKAIGVVVDEFQVTDFRLGQSDIDKVNYSFYVHLGLRDLGNTSKVSRDYHISNELDISGLVDPALARASKDEAGDNETVYRSFFFNKDDYANSSSISVSGIGQTVTAGQGWMYGYLAKASGVDDDVPVWYNVSPADRPFYLLVGTHDEITALDPGNFEQFGGYIVTNPPTLTNSTCGMVESDTFNPIKYGPAPTCSVQIDSGIGKSTGKPYIVAPGFDTDEAPQCPVLDGTGNTRRCLLMLNSYLEPEVQANPSLKFVTGGSGLFNVEFIRDFVMCGYYTHNPEAPSYFQRLLNGSYSRNSTQFGIETFVIGNYANDYDVYDVNSRLDRELFNGSISGVKIRGLPGCRNFNSCSDSPVTGIFAVSDEAKDDYGLGDIACDKPGTAGCDN